MPTTKDGTASETRVPPYIAYKTLRTFLEDLKTNGIPSRIDRSVWGTRFSGSVGTQLMSALRFLRLVGDDDQPTGALKDLVGSLQTDGWQDSLRSAITQAYEPIVTLNLKEMTQQQLTDEFREHYRGQEAVLSKSTRFFLQAVQEAGIEVSGRILKGTRRRGRPRNKTAASRRIDDGLHQPVAPLLDRKTSPMETLIEILDQERMGEEELQAVWTLIRYLKKKGQVA